MKNHNLLTMNNGKYQYNGYEDDEAWLQFKTDYLNNKEIVNNSLTTTLTRRNNDKCNFVIDTQSTIKIQIKIVSFSNKLININGYLCSQDTLNNQILKSVSMTILVVARGSYRFKFYININTILLKLLN